MPDTGNISKEAKVSMKPQKTIYEHNQCSKCNATMIGVFEHGQVSYICPNHKLLAVSKKAS